MEKLLALRKEKKAKKPKFVRQDSHKKPRLQKSGWRKPKGQDSNMRVGNKGYRRTVSSGYRAPAEVRGLSGEGLITVVVSTEKDLEKLDSKKEGVIIASSVGLRKKILIINKCKELKLKILNLKDPEEYVKGKESQRKAAKKTKDEAKEKKELKKKETEKSKKKASPAKTKTEDNKEKKELDKILTKKDSM